jgi:acetyltransferase-like isoleucine patch superfamily enzyme
MMLEKCILFFKRCIAKIHSISLRPLFYHIGTNVSVYPPFRFKNLAQVKIGSRCTIHEGGWIHVIDSGKNNVSPVIVIGDYVSLGMNCTVSAAEKIIIEDHVFTARNVYISDHEHEYRDIERPTGAQGICKIAGIKIGAETWIGQNAVILPGTTIGRHCVIGANAVVNCDVPDFSIAVGIPATVIRSYNPATGCWEKVQK